MTKHLFSNKKKNIFVGIIGVIYLVFSLLQDSGTLRLVASNGWSVASLRFYLNYVITFLLSKAAVLAVLICIVLAKRQLRFKEVILLIGFGISLIQIGYSFVQTLSTGMFTGTNPYALSADIISCILVVASVVAFVGTLLMKKGIKTFRVAMIIKATAIVLAPFIDILYRLQVYGMYIWTIFQGTHGTLLEEIIHAMFFLGLFLMTFNKPVQAEE